MNKVTLEKEEILDKVATRMMHEWSVHKFKITHKRLFDAIMESMDEYAGQQVKKLNIDDVSVSLKTCKKCEMLGSIAPCDECYYNKYKN